jgi:hypothetical protein
VEFDGSYNCDCILRLASGREIVLDKLTQSRTYAGLLEGDPNRKSNNLSIRWLVEQVARDNPDIGEPYLIEPLRRDYFLDPGDMQADIDRQLDRPDELKHIPEWLPPIVCVGEFHSLQPARDNTKDASSLIIVWYQSDFGLDSDAIENLRLVDWDTHATDWEY